MIQTQPHCFDDCNFFFVIVNYLCFSLDKKCLLLHCRWLDHTVVSPVVFIFVWFLKFPSSASQYCKTANTEVLQSLGLVRFL